MSALRSLVDEVVFYCTIVFGSVRGEDQNIFIFHVKQATPPTSTSSHHEQFSLQKFQIAHHHPLGLSGAWHPPNLKKHKKASLELLSIYLQSEVDSPVNAPQRIPIRKSQETNRISAKV